MKNILRLSLFLLLPALLLPALPGARAAEPFKVGYLDMQRAMENCAAGQAAHKKLSDLGNKYKADIDAARSKLETAKADLDKQGLLWNEKTRRDKEEELRRMDRDYQRLLKDSEDDLKTKVNEYSESIAKELLKLAEEIGKEEGYSLILEKRAGGIIYAPSSVDLTDKLIKTYDSRKQ
jgi:outer membrane protein